MKTNTDPPSTVSTPRIGIQTRFKEDVNAEVQEEVALYQIDELSPKSHEFAKLQRYHDTVPTYCWVTTGIGQSERYETALEKARNEFFYSKEWEQNMRMAGMLFTVDGHFWGLERNVDGVVRPCWWVEMKRYAVKNRRNRQRVLGETVPQQARVVCEEKKQEDAVTLRHDCRGLFDRLTALLNWLRRMIGNMVKSFPAKSKRQVVPQQKYEEPHPTLIW